MWCLDIEFVSHIIRNEGESGSKLHYQHPTWKKIIPRWTPGPLSHASVCVAGKKAFVYGGIKMSSESNSKLFVFDSINEIWD